MATTKTLLPAAYQTLEDENGHAIIGGTVTFLETGTAVLAVVYADANGLVISANPLTVDGAGRYSVWLTPGQVVDIEYRDALGALIKTVPGVMAMPGDSGNVDVDGILGDSWMPPTTLVFLSMGGYGVAGFWYIANATQPLATLGPTLGFLVSGPSPGGAATVVRTAGRMEGFSGLVVGALYYASNVPGALSLTPGLYGRLIGQADSPTTLVIWPNPPALDAPKLERYTGSGTVLALPHTAPVVLINNGSAPLRVEGIAAGYDGQRLRIINDSQAGQTDFVDASPLAAPVDRLYNFALSAPTSIAQGGASRGTVDYVYDQAVPGWRLVAHEQGGWIRPAHNPGAFSGGGGMTWAVTAGNLPMFSYYLRGRMLSVQLTAYNTTVGGVSQAQLYLQIPAGFSANGLYQGAMAAYLATGIANTGPAWQTSAGTIVFTLDLASTTLWPLGSTYIGASMTFEVN